ncbi:hypothetical protein niasHS_005016 [Heterodera schachtii]|uniref:PPPDE domain-containing protein n=1 Tax=Heterodera schachtii TaxID=97005 RepID=A0ABD2JKA5_HETSC
MSRSSSSSSDTSRPNTTVVSEFQPMIPCEHPRPKMRATHVRIWHHRMWDSIVFQYITHDSALVTWHCRECNRRSFQTFEFATGGKTDRWGRYLRHQSKERRHVVNIDEADVHREFMLMRGTGHYNLFYYNCKHWAEEFVINITRVW